MAGIGIAPIFLAFQTSTHLSMSSSPHSSIAARFDETACVERPPDITHQLNRPVASEERRLSEVFQRDGKDIKLSGDFDVIVNVALPVMAKGRAGRFDDLFKSQHGSSPFAANQS